MIKILYTSIGKKQLVAISGLAMVFFLIAHLLGNFLMYVGPDAINAYAKKLHDLGPLLWVARVGLLAMFITHFTLIGVLIYQNKKARKNSYSQPLHKKTRSIFTKTMKASGIIVFLYIFIHLLDFTFTKHTMDNSVIDGVYYGLYGHVYNYFLNPIRSVFYIVAMFSIGFHLVHGIQSTMQTFGFNHPVYTPLINKTGWVIALFLALGFSSIPIYVIIHNLMGFPVGGG